MVIDIVFFPAKLWLCQKKKETYPLTEKGLNDQLHPHMHGMRGAGMTKK